MARKQHLLIKGRDVDKVNHLWRIFVKYWQIRYSNWQLSTTPTNEPDTRSHNEFWCFVNGQPLSYWN